jgi:branched-chain amino acid transport system substrate-binding protein
MSIRKSAVVATALAAFLAGCSGNGGLFSSSSSTEVPKYAAGPREMKIAVVGPQSGGNDVFGRQLGRGVGAAVAELSAKGGLLGKSILTLSADDACDRDANKARETAEGLVREQVVFVVGHFCSGSSIAAADVYQNQGVIMMSPASSSPTLTKEPRSYIFRMFFTDDFQALIAAQYVADHYPGRRIAVVDDGSEYGKSLVTRMRNELASRGIEVALEGHIAPHAAAYPNLIDSIAANHIDILYYGGLFTEAAAIASGLRERGLQTLLFGGDGVLTSEYGRLAGAAAEGTLITSSPDLTTLPPATAIVERMRAAGEDPTGYTLYAYAAVQAWSQAVQIAGSLNANAISQALHGNSFDTVIGKATFDEHGDLANPPIVIKQWVNDRFVQVWPQIGS